MARMLILAALASAVNELQSGALGLVAEQAAARRALSGNLEHVARRNQALVARALGFISSLEESERDPRALDNLFRIDHLTTRMRRTTQSLLVLADVPPDHHPTAPMEIGDVVRAALSEVEQFGAVELADTPVFDRIWGQYPHAQLKASGEAVGLPPGQMGNSEVGHNAMGAGRVVDQGAKLVEDALATGAIWEREAWREVWRGPAVRSILRHLKAWQGRGFVKAVRGLGC